MTFNKPKDKIEKEVTMIFLINTKIKVKFQIEKGDLSLVIIDYKFKKHKINSQFYLIKKNMLNQLKLTW